MIYCPECGTANRDGSKFCNECGHGLGGKTGVKCPQCETFNPVQSVFCRNCGGRLLGRPASSSGSAPPAIKGLSLPTRGDLGDEQGDLAPGTTPEAAAEEEVPAPAEAAGDVPAWLRELGATLSADNEPAGPAQALEPEELPAWLEDLRASLPEAGEEVAPPAVPMSAPPVERAEELPAQPEPTAPLPAPVEPAEEFPPSGAEPVEAAEEIPDWLAELRPPPDAEPSAPLPAPVEAAGELPDWLAELRPPPGAEPSAPPARAAAPGEEVPAASPGEEELPVREEELPGGELPAWLAGLRPPALSQEPGPEEEEEPLPGWLAGMHPAAPKPAPSPQAAPAEGGAPPAGMPAWLADLRASSPLPEEELEGGELPAEGAEAAEEWLVPSGEAGMEEESLAQAEIPAWLLALKPRELKGEGEVAAEAEAIEPAVEQTGLLAGIRSVLPVEMAIAQPRAAAAEITEAALVETPEAQLFAEIVALPLVSAVQAVARPAPRLLSLLPRWIAFAALLLAVAVPLMLSRSPLNRTLEPSAAVSAAYDAIDSVSDAPVLVAVDYDPATGGEMDVVAESIIRHLMDRQARIVVVSLLPTGPATADALIARVAADQPNYQPGSSRYANLGYLPGQATAIRLMAQALPEALPRDFAGTPVAEVQAMAGVTSTQSFALIVELAAGADTLRWWIEQAATPYDTPLVAGVSAMVDPFARPYYETERPQIAGVVGGVLGAAAYDGQRTGQSDVSQPLAARLDALLAGQVVLILVILLGNVVYLVQRRMGGK